MKKPSVEVVLFSYGGVLPRTVDCLLTEVNDGLADRRMSYRSIADDALISRSRSRAASAFLARTGPAASDVLFMIDHDIEWAPGDVLATVDAAHSMQACVAGLYACRAKGGGWSSRLKEAEAVFNPGGVQMLEADFLATGFLAIPRAVLATIAAASTDITKSINSPYLVKPCIGMNEQESFFDFFRCLTVLSKTYPGKYEMLSEDWSFSARVKELTKTELYVYEKPVLRHWGYYPFQVSEG